MDSFEDKQISDDVCRPRLGPQEPINALQTVCSEFYEDLRFKNCSFVGCGLSTYGSAMNRSFARRINIESCRVNSFYGNGAAFEENHDRRTQGFTPSNQPKRLRIQACHGWRQVWSIPVQQPRQLRRRKPKFRVRIGKRTLLSQYRLGAGSGRNCKRVDSKSRGAVPVELIRRNPAETVHP